MSVTVFGDLNKNKLIVEEGFLEKSSGVINFNGQGSTIAIGRGSSGYAISLVVEHDCTIEIGTDCALGALEVFLVRGSSALIGNGTGFTSKAEIHCHETSTIRIGNDCLIASNTWFTSSDMHSIIDLKSGQRINFGSDITVHDKVWIANNVMVLKGVEIGSGSIVGAGSIVTSKIAKNCLAVGNPAKTIKTGVSWEHSR